MRSLCSELTRPTILCLKHARCKQCIGKNSSYPSWKRMALRFTTVTCCVEFYQVLYRSRRLKTNTIESQQPHRPSMDDAPPVILPAEVEASIKKLGHSKASGEANITGGVLQDAREAVVNLLTRLFNKCLQLHQVPKAWLNAVMILLHKRGKTSDIKNYRPISLLPIIYKVFSHILLQWILQSLDFHQPREQAGFTAGFLTIDHLHLINQLQEKGHEHNIPLCFVFVDYGKAFNSIEFEPIFHALKDHGIDKAYLDIINPLYHEATSVMCLHTDSTKFRLERGVRQGDNISPRPFTSCLQDAIIGKINWKDRDIKINGQYLAHLIFADDIVLIAKSTSELQMMVQDIHETSKPVGLSMHLGKTKVMCNPAVNKTDIEINGRKIIEVDNYIYLSQMMTKHHDQEQELRYRTGLGWTAFSKLDSIMWNKRIPLRLKMKVHNECILK